MKAAFFATLVFLAGILMGSLVGERVSAQVSGGIISRPNAIGYHHEKDEHLCFIVTGGGGIVETKDEVCH